MRELQKALPVVAAAMAAVIAPPKPLAPSAWAREHLTVPDGPYAGERWEPNLTPYVVPILDELAPDAPATRVVVRKSAQTGLSVAGIAWVGSVIDRAPCRIGYVLPTIDALNEFNREKLTPSIEQSTVLAGKVAPQVSRSGSGSTQHSKRFPGGSLVLINANSAPDLRAKTLKYGVADEVDEWVDDLDNQGDPLDLLLGRFIAFHATADWKLFEISTPTLAGSSRIDADFQAGDQRFWTMPCPHCGEDMRFSFERLRFNETPPHAAYMTCPANGCAIEHHEKARMVRSGRFVPTNPDGAWPSYHVDALTSLLTTWDHVAEAYLKARGDPRKEKSFFNLWLGLPYEMRGDAPEWERLMERREDYPENRVPPQAVFLVAGADVQHDGIWVEVSAWAPNQESWTVSARWLEGETTDPDAGAWASLAALYEERFEDAHGNGWQLDLMAVDAGDGGRANQVYAWTRMRPRAMAINGQPGWTKPAISTPTKVDINLRGRRTRKGAMLWPIGTWSLKAEFYGNLEKRGIASGQTIDPPGYCHFGAFLGEKYFRQITAEYLAEETFRGKKRRVWRESGPNHLLDCRIYAMAMVDYLGIRRLTDEQFRELRRQRGAPEVVAAPDLTAPESVRLAAAAAAGDEAGPAGNTAPPASEPKPRRSIRDIARKLNG